MAKKRKASTRAKASSVKIGRRRSNTHSRANLASQTVGRFVLPMLISCILLIVLLFMGLTGYQTATASDFFRLQDVQIRGNERTPSDDIRRIVTAAAEKPGVWNADLSEIRAKIEKFPFVRSASVSRALPDGIRVKVTERIPVAVVHLSAGDYLVDNEAVILAPSSAKTTDLPFILKGWDEAKSEKAATDNLARLKLYKKMVEEWRTFDLAKRVKEVDLADLKYPSAVIEDSGNPISVNLAKDNLGVSLKRAIEASSGKGNKIRTVNSAGLYPVIQYVE
jgi:cell division septal protein FtsQ